LRARATSRVRIRACQAQTTYTRKEVLFGYNQSSSNWREWTYKTISQRAMGKLTAGGDVEPISRMDDDGKVRVVGHRATRPIRKSDASPQCLNAATMAVAAMGEKDEWTPADEAQLDKFRLWPFIGDNRATCVRSRPTAIETGYLETLLAAGSLASALTDPLPAHGATA
jgi:hypothetical protein